MYSNKFYCAINLYPENGYGKRRSFGKKRTDVDVIIVGQMVLFHEESQIVSLIDNAFSLSLAPDNVSTTDTDLAIPMNIEIFAKISNVIIGHTNSTLYWNRPEERVGQELKHREPTAGRISLSGIVLTHSRPMETHRRNDAFAKCRKWLVQVCLKHLKMGIIEKSR